MSSTTKRAYNFSAGPAALPVEVLLQAQAEFVDYQGNGASFMELSHRDANGPVQNIVEAASQNLRDLLRVPDSHTILFFQGGAHAQFAAIPLNLLGGTSCSSAAYIRTGFWSDRAIGEARPYCSNLIVPVDAESTKYTSIPSPSSWDVPTGAGYVHICANETIHGLEYHSDPVVPGDTVLVGDFTSTLLSRPVDWSKYGLVYASGGKNLGPAGVCVVVIRKDLLLLPAHPLCPSVLNYNKMASSTPIPNIYNTPPTFLIYMMNLVLEDCKKKGGVEGAQSRAIKRSSMLYEITDKSGGFYMNNVEPEFRSRMNIPLRIRGGDKELEAKFVKEAEKEGLFQLYGHPLFGGLRITLYNGVPDDAVHKLAQFMKDFHASNSTEQ